jgi:uroporphyrinogen III methyltransferase/synthase
MTVHLVGAGPGDPALMTVRSLELIAHADVIVHDRLIPDRALAAARPDAQLIYVGKAGGGPSAGQDQINRVLIEHGQAGREVVRLKGGDPFVFGRGGEEAEALHAAGIEYEVVPGVTAGIAGPAYAGIPVTHREMSSAVAFVTGHEDPAKPDSALDWRALAAFPGTLVVYMGVRQLPAITARLVEGGRPADEPAALVQRGTWPDQRAVVGTLGTLAELAERERIRAPTVAVFGAVAALRDSLAWFERRPLHGVTVAVTRARAQASQMALRLSALGAAVIEAPAIRIEPLDGPAPNLSSYDLVCLTSPNGVDALFDRLRAAGQDARALAGATVAVIGPGTARRLARHGIRADVIPESFLAEGLVEALSEVPVQRALVARAEEARDVLPAALRQRGAEVDVLALYRTVVEPIQDARVDRLRGADYITFTSSSTVKNFLRASGGAEQWRPGPRLVSIGPVTSATMREHGLEPDVEAQRHDIDGVIQAMVGDAATR